LNVGAALSQRPIGRGLAYPPTWALRGAFGKGCVRFAPLLLAGFMVALSKHEIMKSTTLNPNISPSFIDYSSAEHRSASFAVGMAEDAKRVFIEATEAACYTDAPEHLGERRARTQRQREAQLVLENLHEQRVFYHPGARLEWEPLRRLTHLCDTFIFCDWNVAAESVTGDFGLAGVETDFNFIIPLCKEDVAYLTDLQPLPRRIREGVRHLVGAHVEPSWGKYAQLTRTVGDVTRKLHFFYLGMEGLTAYFNLFAPHKMAPRVLCMKLGADPNAVLFGNGANGLLGRIIRGVGKSPEQMVGVGGPGSDWLYPTLWQKFPGWPESPNAYVRENFEPGQIQPTPLGGAPRRVIVRRGLLTSENVGDCDAIVLTLEEYKQHLASWPAHLRIFLLVPPDQEGQLPHPDDRVRFLGQKAPLQNVLNNLAAACGQENIRRVARVASVGIGYEDEGPELNQWRQQAGLPLELTIYCEHEGDVVSFGPHADVIQ
jgi:hypothetical protein